jgi:hypothetical protein
MKTFTYVAAVALLTAGTAFAQSSNPNASTLNNSTPTPSARGPVESPGTSSTTQPGTINQSGSTNRAGSANMNSSGSMNNSSSMDRSTMDRSDTARSRDMSSRSGAKARIHHVARNGRDDARENEETMQLNRQQLAGTSASMGPSGSMGYSSGIGSPRGVSSSGGAYPFNNGSPQQAQGGGVNCTPDNPSCGTARQNPAINSSPQHRTYPNQQQ